MSRKDTVYGHRHVKSREEIERLANEMKKRYNMKISLLEADYIMAKRSRHSKFFPSEMIKEIRKMRGVI